MLDKNGIEIKTGDIVEISGAYFKNDNGLYFVENSAGDPDWLGSEHSLKKISKNGKIRKSKNSTGFCPIMVTVNDREKRVAAKEWNREYATIEIKSGIDTSEIENYFSSKSRQISESIKYLAWTFGKESEVVKNYVVAKEHYEAVVKRLSGM